MPCTCAHKYHVGQTLITRNAPHHRCIVTVPDVDLAPLGFRYCMYGGCHRPLAIWIRELPNIAGGGGFIRALCVDCVMRIYDVS
jgi:hypothetical protein